LCKMDLEHSSEVDQDDHSGTDSAKFISGRPENHEIRSSWLLKVPKWNIALIVGSYLLLIPDVLLTIAQVTLFYTEPKLFETNKKLFDGLTTAILLLIALNALLSFVGLILVIAMIYAFIKGILRENKSILRENKSSWAEPGTIRVFISFIIYFISVFGSLAFGGYQLSFLIEHRENYLSLQIAGGISLISLIFLSIMTYYFRGHEWWKGKFYSFFRKVKACLCCLCCTPSDEQNTEKQALKSLRKKHDLAKTLTAGTKLAKKNFETANVASFQKDEKTQQARKEARTTARLHYNQIQGNLEKAQEDFAQDMAKFQVLWSYVPVFDQNEQVLDITEEVIVDETTSLLSKKKDELVVQ